MTIRNSLIIEKAKELYLKYNGRNHRLIEKAMHDAGCLTFTRRVLYSRKYKNGQTRTGWIEKYGWRDELRSERRSEDTPVLMSAKHEQDLKHDKQDRQDRNEQHLAHPVHPVNTADRQQPTDFPAWLKKVSSNLHWDWAYQKLIYEKLNDITTGKTKRLMIFLPPRHGKSELVTVRYSAWRLQQEPALNIILGSYNQRLANRFSRKVRITWEDSLSEPPAPLLPEEGWPKAGVVGAAGGFFYTWR